MEYRFSCMLMPWGATASACIQHPVAVFHKAPGVFNWSWPWMEYNGRTTNARKNIQKDQDCNYFTRVAVLCIVFFCLWGWALAFHWNMSQVGEWLTNGWSDALSSEFVSALAIETFPQLHYPSSFGMFWGDQVQVSRGYSGASVNNFLPSNPLVVSRGQIASNFESFGDPSANPVMMSRDPATLCQ